MITEQMPLIPPAPPFLFERNDWLPVGVVLAFAGQVSPQSDDSQTNNPQTNVEAWGWMVCDGRELEIGTYPELFAVLGYLYGKVGNDKFCLPDYRGYFLRGVASNHEVDKGWDERTKNPAPDSTGSDKDIGSIQEEMVQMHEHQYQNYPGGGATPGDTGTVNPSTPTTQYSTDLYDDSSGAKPLSGTETRPVNIAVNYIIKYAYLGRPVQVNR